MATIDASLRYMRSMIDGVEMEISVNIEWRM